MRGLVRNVVTALVALSIALVGVYVITGGSMDLSPYWEARDREVGGPGDVVWLYPFLPRWLMTPLLSSGPDVP